MGRKKLLSDADLLKVAQAAFVEQGFSASTRKIAKAAGVSEAVLFQRYKTKEDLFFAAMVPPPIRLEVALGPEGDFREQLHRLFLALVDYFRVARPIFAQLSAHPGFRFDEFAMKHPESSMIGMFQRLMHFLRDRLDPDQDVSSAVLLLITSANSIAYFEGLGAHNGRFEDFIVDGMVRHIWEGLKPKGVDGEKRPLSTWPLPPPSPDPSA